MQPSGWENYSSAGTVNVKPGAGRFYGITVNTSAAGAITIYDSADTTVAGKKKIATLKSSIAEGDYLIYPGGLPFSAGLTIVLAAASDITVVFT